MIKKIAGLVFSETYTTTRTAQLNQGVLEVFVPSLPTSQSFSLDFRGITKPLCADFAAVRSNYAERFQRYALLSYVAGSSWRVIIPVFFAQFFGGDVTVLQDMVDHCLRALCGDSLYAIEELLRKFGFLFGFILQHRLGLHKSAR